MPPEEGTPTPPAEGQPPPAQAPNQPPPAQAPSALVDADGNFVENWWERLPSEDLKAAPSLQNFKTMEGLAKSYLSAQRMLGNSPHAVIVPDDNSTDEERAEFYEKVGRPETPEGYEFKPPEGLEEKGLNWNEEMAKGFANKAHELGLSKKQAEGLMDWHSALTLESFQSADEQLAQERQAAESQLKKEWGNAYQANVDLANRIVQKFDPEQKLIEAGLGNNPELVRLFASIGKAISEDKLIAEQATHTPAAAMQQVNAIMGDMNHPYHNPEHPGHKDAVAKVAELYEQIHPTPETE